MNLRCKSAWIHYRVGVHEMKCRIPALESLVLSFRNGGFHHTGIDGFRDRTGGVKPSGILNSLYSQIIDLRKEVEQAEKVKICIETLHTQKKELTQSKSKDLGL